MKFKLDENLGNRGAAVLADAGHDVKTVRDQQLQSAPDRQLMDVCRDEDRCLVTLDLDFANPLVFPPAQGAGTIVLRLPDPATPADLEEALLTLINSLRTNEVRGALWIIQRCRLRIYQPMAEG